MIVVPVFSDDWAVEIDPTVVDIADFDGIPRHRVPINAILNLCLQEYTQISRPAKS